MERSATLCWAIEMTDTQRGSWLLGRYAAVVHMEIPSAMSGYRLATWDTRQLAREFCRSKKLRAKEDGWLKAYWRGAKAVRVHVTVQKI